MPDLIIRNVPQPVLGALEALAEADQVPLEEEARRLLARAVRLPADASAKAGKALNQIERFRRGLALPPGSPDSVELLREDRAR